ncbi:hypothetical protein FPV67DRAFT_1677798 [Lyophyllum atratum]|nr:hypothetical protein FPV67DRAFT_1677798 [Lyophyllum atratum]
MGPSRTTTRRPRKDKALRQQDHSTGYDETLVLTKNKKGEDVPVYIRTPLPLQPAAEPSRAASSGRVHDHDVQMEHVQMDQFTFEESDAGVQVPVRKRKEQGDYLREFVEQIPGLLEGLLAREALQPQTMCNGCTDQNYGQWRCRDCTAPEILCRRCIRVTHRTNPLHRIERWTGEYFRAAEMWEVGGYLSVPHCSGNSLCEINRSHPHKVENAEAQNDAADQNKIWSQTGSIPGAASDENEAAAEAAEVSASGERLAGDHFHADGGGPQVGGMTRDTIEGTLEGDEDCEDDWIFEEPQEEDDMESGAAEEIPDPQAGTRPRKDTLGNSFASAYQYWQKVERVSRCGGTRQVPDLYRELRRLSRQWRWMKKIEWAGFGHEAKDPNNPAPGELAIFCPTCPQPGVNLPEDWNQDPNREVFIRNMTIDGNFKADHVRQPNPGSDVWLSEGGGMMAKRTDIAEFMSTHDNRPTNEPCENMFRAIEQAMLTSKACDINGIVAVACARHGCFAPNSMTDLPAGEQQRCADWAVLQVIATTNMTSIENLFLLYDIMCQYIMYLKERIGDLLPEHLIIKAAIGVMHVHGHQLKCFPRFSPSFVPGAAIVTGEILESLWSTLNSISPMARTCTLAHRVEILDDHMTDSNWKKLLGMPAALCRGFRRAVSMSASAEAYYQNLRLGSAADLVDKWDREIEDAEARRQEDPRAQVMDIMLARPAASSHNDPIPLVHRRTPEEDWIQLGLDIEGRQSVYIVFMLHHPNGPRLSLLGKVRKLARSPRADDLNAVEKEREQIWEQITSFSAMQERLGISAGSISAMDDTSYVAQYEETEDAAEEPPQPQPIRGVPTARRPHADVGPPPPESVLLPLPSALVDNTSPLREVELSLRQTHVDKLLHDLREAIAEKSFLYSHVVRVAPRKNVRTRSRTTILKIDQSIAGLSAAYTKSRAVFERLGAPSSTFEKYKILDKDDVKGSTAILDPNIPGSTRQRLSWIWQMGEIEACGDSDGTMREFERVHYLRARANRNRWAEELRLVGYEMQWTTRYFLHQATIWRDRGLGAAAAGKRANSPLRSLTMDAINPVTAIVDNIYEIGNRYQDILFYCESRLRAQLHVFLRENVEKDPEMNKWFGERFFAEVAFALAQLGSSVAWMYPVHVPSVLKYMAAQYYPKVVTDNTIHMTDTLVELLAYPAPDDYAEDAADGYHEDWWNYLGQDDFRDVIGAYRDAPQVPPQCCAPPTYMQWGRPHPRRDKLEVLMRVQGYQNLFRGALAQTSRRAVVSYGLFAQADAEEHAEASGSPKDPREIANIVEQAVLDTLVVPLSVEQLLGLLSIGDEAEDLQDASPQVEAQAEEDVGPHSETQAEGTLSPLLLSTDERNPMDFSPSPSPPRPTLASTNPMDFSPSPSPPRPTGASRNPIDLSVSPSPPRPTGASRNPIDLSVSPSPPRHTLAMDLTKTPSPKKGDLPTFPIDFSPSPSPPPTSKVMRATPQASAVRRAQPSAAKNQQYSPPAGVPVLPGPMDIEFSSSPEARAPALPAPIVPPLPRAMDVDFLRIPAPPPPQLHQQVSPPTAATTLQTTASEPSVNPPNFSGPFTSDYFSAFPQEMFLIPPEDEEYSADSESDSAEQSDGSDNAET